ncbi:MAG: hypothetical protein V3U54_13455 [Thermodesulfobacteriota bacterium]
MNIRTRHMAILTYAGIASLLVLKDIIDTPETAIALIAPLIGMFTWDKIKGTK